MVSAIATVLKSKLSNLLWVDRFGGLVVPATRAQIVTGADGVQVVTGYQTYPVACDVNAADCWEKGLYKHFEPDSKKQAIAYFLDDSGVSLRSSEGPKNAVLKFNFSLRLVFWMNVARLGQGFTGGGCNLSGRVAPYVMAQLWGNHTAFAKFDAGVEEEIYREIEVSGMQQLPKTPAIFSPFTFATDGEKRGLFLYPYDYFGI